MGSPDAARTRRANTAFRIISVFEPPIPRIHLALIRIGTVFEQQPHDLEASTAKQTFLDCKIRCARDARKLPPASIRIHPGTQEQRNSVAPIIANGVLQAFRGPPAVHHRAPVNQVLHATGVSTVQRRDNFGTAIAIESRGDRKTVLACEMHRCDQNDRTPQPETMHAEVRHHRELDGPVSRTLRGHSDSKFEPS